MKKSVLRSGAQEMGFSLQ